MFTGIIQTLGCITEIEVKPSGCHIAIQTHGLDKQSINLGDSVAVNGVCLTVVAFDKGIARFDVSPETLSITLIKDWQVGERINLEAALNLQTPLGGHLVTGHVDGIGNMLLRKPDGGSIKMVFGAPASLGPYIAQKGSICIDGVSLTTNQILEDKPDSTTFSVMLVPHTLSATSLQQLKEGDQVHLEIDIVARYLARMQDYKNKTL